MSGKMNRRKFLAIGGKAALGLGMLLPSHGWSQVTSVSARTFYAAPQARKNADGSDPRNAAKWTDAVFWEEVEASLEHGDVVVNFVGGTYQVSDRRKLDMPTLSLSGLGHDSHRLVLQGMSPKAVRITRHLSDGVKDSRDFLKLSRCRNIILRHLTFTA